MWNGLINNETRPTIIDRALYSSARNSFKTGDGAMSDFLIGWVGWMASYNGRFFDGGYSGHDVNGRDYISEQIKNTERGLYLLKNVVFTSKSYIDFKLKEPCIIYCDPPYAGTKGYSNSSEFNHDQFWEWCRFMAIQGHQVFISEYSSPSDFECIWRSEITNSMGLSKTYKPIECLFTFKASH